MKPTAGSQSACSLGSRRPALRTRMPSNYSYFSCILTRVLQGGQTLQIWTFENVCIVPCHSVSGKAPPFQNLATFVLVFVIVALSLPCAGQVRPASKTLAIRHISAKITVDGRLDEPVWKTIDPVIDFTQTSPDLGKPISERTEALIFYDDDNLYVGFRCYDSEPKKIVRRMGPHDSSGNSDSVSLFIDPFHDMRTGYYFSVSAGSVQFDALSSEDNSSSDDSPFSRIHDSTWDGIWQSAARLEEWGWSAEFVIPFKSVRLPRASTQVWGLNLRRSMPRKHEVAYWNAVSRFDDTMRPSKSGTLTGLDGLHVGHALELIPFITTKYRRAPWQPESAGTDLSGGLDVRYGLAANLTANLTVNPDFGETEADRFTSEISRYEIFFPEKRKFFTEGANYFSTPLSLFFSRRIGAVLPDGDPQRVLEGGKVTGKAGGWTLGILEAATQAREFRDPAAETTQTAPGAFFGVARLGHSIFEKSEIGFMSVNRFQSAGPTYDVDGNLITGNETAQGVDLRILKGDHLSWGSQFVANTSSLYPGFDAQHLGWTSNFAYDSEILSVSAGSKFLGRNTDFSQIGYEPETDRWTENGSVEYKPFLNRWGIRQLSAGLAFLQSNGTAGELESSGRIAYLDFGFKNFWSLQVSNSYDQVRFNEFSPCSSTAACDARPTPRLDSTRVYDVPYYRIELNSNGNKPLVLSASYLAGKLVQFDENVYGSQRQADLSLSARLGRRLRGDLTGTQVREYLSNHSHFQNRNYLISRWMYQFTPKFRTRVLAQFSDDHHRNNVGISALAAYDFTARSAAYIGYNRQRYSPIDPGDLGDSIFVKISYLFSF